MKRLLAVIGCVLLLSGVAFADAKFFWRQSAAGLSSILGMATNDYAIVAASDNTVCFYKYSGTAWDNVGCIGPYFNDVYMKNLTGDGTGSITGFNIPLYLSNNLSIYDALIVGKTYDNTGNFDNVLFVGQTRMTGLPSYDNNASAISGGLDNGAMYKTSTGILMIVY